MGTEDTIGMAILAVAGLAGTAAAGLGLLMACEALAARLTGARLSPALAWMLLGALLGSLYAAIARLRLYLRARS